MIEIYTNGGHYTFRSSIDYMMWWNKNQNSTKPLLLHNTNGYAYISPQFSKYFLFGKEYLEHEYKDELLKLKLKML